MDSLNGWKTYGVFTIYLIVAVLAGQGIEPSPDQAAQIDTTAAAVKELLENPLVVWAIGVGMRWITRVTTGA